MNRFFVALGVFGALFQASTAYANGRFPSASHVEVDTADPAHIVLRTTYGLVVTRDGGTRWDWVCEKEMSYGGIWDPPIGLTTGGVVLVGLPDGLSVSTPDTCQFSRSAALEGQFVADLAVDKKKTSRAVVLTSVPLGMTFDTRLFLTEDGGASFVQVGDVFPANLRGLTVDLCASDPNVVYVSGILDGSMPQGAVLRSANGGMSYETSIVPGSDKMHGPFIGAVDPQNADRVYVRLDGTPGHLFVSEDGSKTWQEIFTGEGLLLGFSLAPDGQTLIVGGEKDGVWRSPVANWAFERTSLLHARCLRWADAGIYTCTEQALDGFSVGLSVTEGSTFRPLTKLSDLCGPVPCAMPICSSDWPPVRDILGATSCVVNGSSSSGSQGGNGGMGGTGGNNNVPPATSGGCACQIGDNHPNKRAWSILPIIALWRRRKKTTLQTNLGSTAKRTNPCTGQGTLSLAGSRAGSPRSR